MCVCAVSLMSSEANTTAPPCPFTLVTPPVERMSISLIRVPTTSANSFPVIASAFRVRFVVTFESV